MPVFGIEGQLKLLRARVAVVGAGGLGGLAVELLARAGTGELVIVDGDRFGEDNLNRQILCRIEDIGAPKTEAAARRVREINPAVTPIPRRVFLDDDNADGILQGCDAALDALDHIGARLALERACARVGIPLVHGSIGGLLGEVAVSAPGSGRLEALFGADGPARGAEVELGTPTPTPAAVAALQVSETVRLLTGGGGPLAENLLICDLDALVFPLVRLKNREPEP
ncbi:MAG TPA: HesA/MoeB/ThiF family protein [bacterium]|nr:HesA/MoeB/ThiF family protein [bacterium]